MKQLNSATRPGRDLSANQLSVWLAQKLAPGQTVYNLGEYLDIRGPLDPLRFEQVVKQVAARTDALHVRVVEDDVGPRIFVAPERHVSFEVFDFCDHDDPIKAAEAWMYEDIAGYVDLAQGSVFNSALFQIESQRWLWFARYHHISADGISQHVFAQRVAAVYSGQGIEDYPSLFRITESEQAYRSSSDFDLDRRFWQEQLADIPQPVTLSGRKSVRSGKVLRRSGDFSRERLDALCAKGSGWKRSAVFLAAGAVYHHRLTGMRDLVIGMAFARRLDPDTRQVAGMASGVLPIRLIVGEGDSFADLVEQARARVRAAVKHQRYGDIDIRNDLGLGPDDSIYSLFVNAMSFNYNLTFGPCEVQGAQYMGNWMVDESHFALFDRQCGEYADMVMISKPENYSQASFNGHHERFLSLLNRLVDVDVHQPVSEIDVLGDDERHQVLTAFNHHDRAEGVCITELFSAQVARRGDAVAVEAGEAQLTYAELDDRANRLARRLQQTGVGPDALVGMTVGRSLEMIVGLLAILKAGGAYVPIDATLPTSRREMLVRDTGLKLVLTTAEHASLFSDLPVQLLDPLNVGSQAVIPVQPTAKGLAYINFTSGSSGRPKGVLVTHEAVVRLVRNPNYVTLNEQTRMTQIAPIHFDAATFEIWGALLNGGTVVLPPPGPLDLGVLADTLETQAVNTFWVTTGLFNRVVDEILPSLAGLDFIITGGEVASIPHMRRLMETHPQVQLIHAYGPTENTTYSTCHPMRADENLHFGAPIGPPINETQCLVLDATLQPTATGMVGDLYLAGTGLARGYLNHPRLTAERFLPNPHATESGDRMYLSGDRCSWREDGVLMFSGRADRQIKLRGFRIEPGEIEACLKRHEGVGGVFVFVDKRSDSKRLTAAVQVTQETDRASLQSLASADLPEFMRPQRWIFVDQLPLNANGKVDLRALMTEAVDEVRTDLPRTPMEQRLCEIWCELLGLDELGVHQNVFEAGADSMIVMQAVFRAKKAGMDIKLEHVFQDQTVARLAERQVTPIEDAAMVKRASPERIPLSFAQQRLWFMDRLEKNHAYHVPVGFRLDGSLNVAALAQAFSQLIDRHEILRTRFPEQDEQPYQLIEDRLAFAFEHHDLSRASQPMTEVDRMFKAQMRKPFDMAEGPLWRAELIRIAEDSHVLLLTQHHIISDGWSLGVMYHDLKHFYRAIISGVEASLPPLPMQYADYSLQSHAHYERAETQAHLDWWMKRLKGAAESLELPIVTQRPSRQSFRGGRLIFQVGAETTNQLHILSRNSGATLYMTLLAVYADFLSRYSGAYDLTVGTPVHGRTKVDVCEMIGFFVNTLPLRMQLSPGQTVGERLDAVREEVLAAWSNQDLPFEKLVDAVNPVRQLDRTPLFQAMFVLQPDDAQLSLDGLQVTPIEPALDFAKFDLTLDVKERDGGLEAALEYSLDIFDEAAARRMSGHLLNLLSGYADACEDMTRPLPQLSLMDGAERRDVLALLNDTCRPYPAEASIHALFAEQAARRVDEPALQWLEGELTYRRLDHQAEVLAAELANLGVGLEDRVAVSMPRSPELLVTLLAILKAGGVYTPIDPSWPAERQCFIAKDAAASLLVTASTDAACVLPDDLPRLALDQLDLNGEPKSWRAPHVSGDNAAYINYTSGSTGRPKGVLATHQAVARLVFDTNYVSLDHRTAVLQMSNASFDGATFEIWGPLLHGGRCVLYPDRIPEPALIGRLIHERKINTLFITTALFNRVVAEDPRLFVGIRHLYTGGEVMSAEHMTRAMDALPETTFANIYGPTENTTFSTWQTLDTAPDPWRSAPIGRPITNTRAYVLDPRGEPVPVGVVGELYLDGEGLARGYFRRSGLTAGVFVPNPFAQIPGARMYRTGDLVSRVPDGADYGALRFHGRTDHQVKIRGFRIELGEIESKLIAHEAVKEAVVVVDGVGNDKRLISYLEPQPQMTVPDAAVLRAYLSTSMPDYMTPQVFIHLPKLPLTPTGKVDRKVLPKPETAVIDVAYVEPRNATEMRLQQVWRDVLTSDRREGEMRIGMLDNFFELGGHSLSATQVMSRLRTDFGLDIPVRALFEAPTIAALAAELDRRAMRVSSEDAAFQIENKPLRQIRPMPADAPLPPSYSQERLWILDRMDPGRDTYNMPFGYGVKGRLDEKAFQKALAELVARQDSLRTLFLTVAGQLQPVVLPEIRWILHREDFRGAEDAQAALNTCRLREKRHVFDLARGPLFRFVLVDLPGDEQAFLFNIHHIVSDGWSVRCFLQELAECYEAFTRGAASPLKPLSIQYQDFAYQQRQWIEGGELAPQVDYWRDQLHGLECCELSTDYPRPPIQTHRGAHEILRIEPQLAQQLHTLAEQKGVSLFITLLAAFKVLIHRHTQSEDVAVGAPIACRNFTEVEPLIGFFLNTLVLRTRMEHPTELTFDALLERVRDTALGAYQHQDVPFEKILQELKPERDLSRTPYFQVLFNMFNPSWGDLRIGGVGLEPLPELEVAAKFDLTLYVAERDGGLHIDAVYNADLFKPETIRLWLDQYRALLVGVTADAERRILAFPVTRTTTSLPDPTRSLTTSPPPLVQSILARQAVVRPTATAVVDTQIHLNYAQLNGHANRLAHYLIGHGLQKGDVVAIYAHRNASLITMIMGALKAGCAFLVLDPAHPTLRLSAYARLAKPKALLHITEAGPLPAAFREVLARIRCQCRLAYDRLVAGTSNDPLSSWPDSEPKVDYAPDDLASVVFTSGSTGIPKGVAGKLSGLTQARGWFGRTFQFVAEDRHAMLSGLGHDLMQRDLFTPIFFGASLYIPEHQDIRAPDRLVRWMNRMRISVSNMTPPMVDLLSGAFASAAELKPLEHLRAVFTVGALLTKASVARFRAVAPNVGMVNFYGSTEAQRSVSYYRVPQDLDTCPPEIPLGQGIEGVQLLVLNAAGQPAAVGELGEIYFRSAQMALGYMNNDELNQARFLTNPWTGLSEDRLYRTGDMGRYLPDGTVIFAGRADRQVKLRGQRLELPEVEASLDTYQPIEQSVVVVEDDVLIGYLLPKPDARLEAVEIRSFLAERLPAYMIPSRFMVLDKVPLTVNGKIDDRALPAQARHLTSVEQSRPMNETERAISELFKEVLGLPTVNRDDNFFEIGGSSVQAVQTCYKLQERFNTDLPVIKIFEHPSVEALMRLLTPTERSEPVQTAPTTIETRRLQARKRRRTRMEKSRI